VVLFLIADPVWASTHQTMDLMGSGVGLVGEVLDSSGGGEGGGKGVATPVDLTLAQLRLRTKSGVGDSMDTAVADLANGVLFFNYMLGVTIQTIATVKTVQRNHRTLQFPKWFQTSQWMLMSFVIEQTLGLLSMVMSISVLALRPTDSNSTVSSSVPIITLTISFCIAAYTVFNFTYGTLYPIVLGEYRNSKETHGVVVLLSLSIWAVMFIESMKTMISLIGTTPLDTSVLSTTMLKWVVMHTVGVKLGITLIEAEKCGDGWGINDGYLNHHDLPICRLCSDGEYSDGDKCRPCTNTQSCFSMGQVARCPRGAPPSCIDCPITARPNPVANTCDNCKDGERRVSLKAITCISDSVAVDLTVDDESVLSPPVIVLPTEQVNDEEDELDTDPIPSASGIIVPQGSSELNLATGDHEVETRMTGVVVPSSKL